MDSITIKCIKDGGIFSIESIKGVFSVLKVQYKGGIFSIEIIRGYFQY